MKTLKQLFLPTVALLLLSCSKDSTGPGPTFDNVAGTYTGPITASTQGILMQSVASLTITQNAGNLAGSYGITGTLTDGVTTVPLQGTGTLTGTIDSGHNPSVSLTVKNGICPSVTTTFSGAHDSANQNITLSGSIPIFDVSNCQVVLTFSNIVLILSH